MGNSGIVRQWHELTNLQTACGSQINVRNLSESSNSVKKKKKKKKSDFKMKLSLFCLLNSTTFYLNQLENYLDCPFEYHISLTQNYWHKWTIKLCPVANGSGSQKWVDLFLTDYWVIMFFNTIIKSLLL